MYLSVGGIDFAPYYDFFIGFWNCSESVVFWNCSESVVFCVFYFILCFCHVIIRPLKAAVINVYMEY